MSQNQYPPKGVKVLSLYNGMSCGRLAFEEAGIPVARYVSYEIDDYANKVAKHNYPDDEYYGDVFHGHFTKYKGFDYLIGGSPCTYWSIAQSKNRETTASGMGWELFQQFVRALHEAQPKYFLYENNKSMSNEIRKSIDEAFGFEATYINSALVSAQNRRRLYWIGKRNDDGTYSKIDVPQPEDRHIYLCDVLDNAIPWQDKSFALTTREPGATIKDTLERHRHTMVAEPVGIGFRNRREADGLLYRRFETHCEEKANALTTVQTDSMVAQPIRISTMPKLNGEVKDGQGTRIFDVHGKSVTLSAEGGGGGAKTGLYAIPVFDYPHGFNTGGIRYKNKANTLTSGGNYERNHLIVEPTNIGESKTVQEALCIIADKIGYIPPMFNAYNRAEIRLKAPTLSTGSMATSSCAVCKFEPSKNNPIYKVRHGYMVIKGKYYAIKLPDGDYIIRMLSIPECKRLQTVPEWFEMQGVVSNTRCYKLLGNGWTISVISFILSFTNP